MKEYHKIQTVFKRNPDTNNKTLLEGQYTLPEFEFLKNNTWVWTEKVDGTNIRIMFENGEYKIGGKTDNAQIPVFLLESIDKLFSNELLSSVFQTDAAVCLYGEGYGNRIQKVGGNYRNDTSFVLFDIKIGEWWLKREDVERISKQLNVDVVPIIGEGTLIDMISFVRRGFNSQWGNFKAEGIVARPKVELFDRSGKRIITKLKYKDFPK